MKLGEKINRCILPIILILFSIITSCDKNLRDTDPSKTGKLAPEGFNFETTQKINVRI